MRAAEYIRKNKGAGSGNFSDEGSLPFIACGDWNSLPMSSVLSVMYTEDIDNPDRSQPFVWKIPKGTKPEHAEQYKAVFKAMVKRD